jgi:predicted TIM-barrel fold metal-dependent hydrolase
LRAKAEPERFRAALRNFPKLQVLLAHTGLSKRVETLAVAREFPEQVWLDISGQSVPDLKMILDKFDRDRICFGSDWPFYPLAVALARTLVATETCPDYRTDLLFNNGARFRHLHG